MTKKIKKTAISFTDRRSRVYKSFLTKNLIRSGYNVSIFDKFIYLNKNEIKKILNPKLKLIKGDTRNISQILVQ